MDNTLRMHVAQCKQNLINNKCSICFIELFKLDNTFVEFTPAQEFTHDVILGIVLQQFEDSHDMWVSLYFNNYSNVILNVIVVGMG